MLPPNDPLRQPQYINARPVPANQEVPPVAPPLQQGLDHAAVEPAGAENGGPDPAVAEPAVAEPTIAEHADGVDTDDEFFVVEVQPNTHIEDGPDLPHEALPMVVGAAEPRPIATASITSSAIAWAAAYLPTRLRSTATAIPWLGAATPAAAQGIAAQDAAAQPRPIHPPLVQGQQECPICYEDMSQARDHVRRWPRCHHEFHRRCIAEWMDTQEMAGQEMSCPYCRTRWELVAGDF
ncbi:uncharacterized protein AB675_377 [Cyphellophora attinorum]|uniref:RING-type domain-containing protein n=1 Tax=Cyphellophora attinorum TaxID=1664694 RepID=A0A0N1HBX2_9EURO|nr:uncharacterized protein AB675_377 [Phialophora attinorum]KPI45806.1 hypothetical protein AB675_377 [Phialophora attinorum]